MNTKDELWKILVLVNFKSLRKIAQKTADFLKKNTYQFVKLY